MPASPTSSFTDVAGMIAYIGIVDYMLKRLLLSTLLYLDCSLCAQGSCVQVWYGFVGVCRRKA